MIDLELEDIQYLFSPTDYARGMQYFQQGRVLGLQPSVKDGIPQVEGTVRGTQVYKILFRVAPEGQIGVRCDCPRFQEMGRCKHLAAAMIAYVKEPPASVPPVTDRYGRMLLKSYMDRDIPPREETVPAQLVPKFVPGYLLRKEYPSLSFRVGREKLYAVKNIRTFLEDVSYGRSIALGKNVILDHSIGQFDDNAKALIRILMNEYPEFRSMGRSYASSLGYQNYSSQKNEIVLTGDGFDRFFDLFLGQKLESGKSTLLLCEGDPSVTLKLFRKENCAGLQIQSEDYHFFGNSHSLYALGEDRILRCSEAFQEKVYPLLSENYPEMQLAPEDIPAFCGYVLPEIEGYVAIEDPDALLEEYLPEEMETCFWFDMEEDILTLKLTFRYGETEVAEETPAAQTPQIHRDIRKEKRSSALAERYFIRDAKGCFLSDEGEVYQFLTEHIHQFREHGIVYLSERLNKKQIRSAKASVGVSVSDGMLILDLDTGEFPAEELEALYQSLLKRKKYHRLPDGRFLTLEGGSYEKLAEVAHMLQLSPGELDKGSLKIPAFRGLYLDSVLAGSEDLNVTRDRQFRHMIRNFKSVEESDYIVPKHLESILRPYQKTGFQWLKTLESCGFGGILADEMGLGKTVQVIAFLSSLDRQQTKHPSLVVCPASLVLNWSEEMTRFAPELKTAVILGNAAERKKRIGQASTQDVWVTSYELLRQDIKLYQELEFYACILDEGQHIKNQSTLVSKAVKAVNCRQRFVLTGTPIENRLSELWNLFDFLMPGYLFSHRAFVEKLEKPIIKSKNPEAAAQLRKLVQPFLLRRRKQEVLKELPPKIEYIRRIEMGETERKTYLSAVNAAKNALGDTGKLQILAALTQLRQVCCDPKLCFENYEGETSKLEACLELCAGMTANRHQILLFSQFTSMLDILRQRLDDMGISSFTLQGSTPKEQRAKLVKEFNAGGASVFLISLKAGGTGLNLTAADVVIHYDPWWNLAAQNQATDRAHRIGQRQCVQVYKLIARGTIEEKILDLQDKKAALLDVLSGENEGGILSMSREELLGLLEE